MNNQEPPDLEVLEAEENVNVTPHHPLLEFLIPGVAISLVCIAIVASIAWSAKYLVQFIPIELEQKIFSNSKIRLSMLGTPLPDNSPLVTLVEGLAKGDPSPQYKYGLSLYCTDVPNAFALPGGKIVLTSHLIELLKSENGLAFVLAHEMGHLKYRHNLRALSQGVAVTALLLLVGGDKLAVETTARFLNLANLQYSREHEREADAHALALLVARYGHTSGSEEFFSAMKELEKGEEYVPSFLSTHPALGERIQVIESTKAKSPGAIVKPMPKIVLDCPSK